MNKCILMGRLVRDIEIRYTAGENHLAISRFTVAVNRPKKKGEEKAVADFINCIAFGALAEMLEKYFVKGDPICVTGAWHTGSYENKEGATVYTNELAVAEVDFVPQKKTDSPVAEKKKPTASRKKAAPAPEYDNELPWE